jgi:hypothetical protein
VLPTVTPAALLRIPRPFDHPDFICEVKWDEEFDAAVIDVFDIPHAIVVSAPRARWISKVSLPKWRYGIYQGASTTSWLKVLNSEYALKTGRSELFAARAEGEGARGRSTRLDCCSFNSLKTCAGSIRWSAHAALRRPASSIRR